VRAFSANLTVGGAPLRFVLEAALSMSKGKTCAYCGLAFSAERPHARNASIEKLFEKKGITAQKPCCSTCIMHLFVGKKKETDRLSPIIIVRRELRLGVQMAKGSKWKEREERINEIVGSAEKEIKSLRNQILDLLAKVSALQKIGDEFSADLQQINETRSAKLALEYSHRRMVADAVIADPKLRQRIFTRDGGLCLLCGSVEDLAIDHVIPVLHGGGNEETNLQTLCRPCNSRKGARILDGSTPPLRVPAVAVATSLS
jgi:hypothetical protein